MRENGIYVASRVSHAPLWLALRADGVPIISSWIEEAGEGETLDFAELWDRIRGEIYRCDGLIFYGLACDAPWKGALIEVGMALALNKKVVVVVKLDELEGVTHRPVGSWIHMPGIKIVESIEEAKAEFHL